MTQKKFYSLIVDNAKTIDELHNNIHETYKNKGKNALAHTEACRLFHESFDLLAFPGGLEDGLKLLKEHDPAAIEKAIEFLDADPYFHGSGYIKIDLLKLLKNVVLNKKQIIQLQDILIRVITKPSRQEYRDYCRLARKIFDAAFYDQVQEIIQQSNDSQAVSRAQLMLNAIEQEMRMLKGQEVTANLKKK